MRFILGALAAVAIVGLSFVQPAEARCFWNGFQTVCVHHPHFRPFAYYGGGYARPYWWGGY